jgi:hypothetical protein
VETDIARRALIADFLTKMYAEQSEAYRHHETQRSAVATIMTSIIVALVGWWTFFLGRHRIDFNTVPLTAGVMLVSALGIVLFMKLFERSRVHHSLAEAYINTLSTLMSGEVEDLLRGRVQEIAYVANAVRDYVDRPAERRPFEILFPQGVRKLRYLDEGELADRIARHNPVDPRPIAIPIHNVAMRYCGVDVAKVDLWKLWVTLFTCIFGVALVLTLVGLVRLILD